MIRKINILLSFVILAVALLVAVPRPVYACSCIAPPPPEEARESATAVFAGTVVEKDDNTIGPLLNSADPIGVTFNVTEVWKGSVAERTTVTTARDSASCGYEFNVGDRYLVYAHEGEDGLATSLCSRTSLLANAGEDLSTFGSGSIPAVGVTGPRDTPIVLILSAAVFLFTAALVVLFAVSTIRYRRVQLT